MEQTNGFSIPLSNILRLLWRGLPVALVAAVVVSGLSYFLSRTLTKQYEARASVLVAQNTPDLRSFGVTLTAAPTLDVSAYRKAVLSGPVIQSVMTSLGLAQQDAKSIDLAKTTV